MVADTADGADGVVGSVLAHGRYPDGPRSQPPLAAEDDLNPERAKGVWARRSRPASARLYHKHRDPGHNKQGGEHAGKSFTQPLK